MAAAPAAAIRLPLLLLLWLSLVPAMLASICLLLLLLLVPARLASICLLLLLLLLLLRRPGQWLECWARRSGARPTAAASLACGQEAGRDPAP